MSTKIVTDLECDIPSPKGKPPHEAQNTIRFTLIDVTYEMDLCTDHETRFVKAITPYVEVSRIVRPAPAVAHTRRSRSGSGSTNGHRPPRSRANREHTRAVRDWAKANGIPVNERGRISAIVEAQYAARQPS